MYQPEPFSSSSSSSSYSSSSSGASFLRTKECTNFFGPTGRCRWGDNCNFSHTKCDSTGGGRGKYGSSSARDTRYGNIGVSFKDNSRDGDRGQSSAQSSSRNGEKKSAVSPKIPQARITLGVVLRSLRGSILIIDRRLVICIYYYYRDH